MAFTLTPYARALLRADKDKLGKDSGPWPQYARGDENVRRGESVRSGESAGLRVAANLKASREPHDPPSPVRPASVNLSDLAKPGAVAVTVIIRLIVC